MSFWSNILDTVGLGAATGSSQGDYTFSQQQRDFIKLQFRYGLLLKQKLASGEITQEYYDSHIWLTTQTLEAPYAGWWEEFKTAIDQEDLEWLSKQVGESVASLTEYMGTAIGRVAGGAISGISTGLATGLLGSINFFGWVAIGAIGVGVYYGWKKGLIQRALNLPSK